MNGEVLTDDSIGDIMVVANVPMMAYFVFDVATDVRDDVKNTKEDAVEHKDKEQIEQLQEKTDMEFTSFAFDMQEMLGTLYDAETTTGGDEETRTGAPRQLQGVHPTHGRDPEMQEGSQREA